MDEARRRGKAGQPTAAPRPPREAGVRRLLVSRPEGYVGVDRRRATAPPPAGIDRPLLASALALLAVGSFFFLLAAAGYGRFDVVQLSAESGWLTSTTAVLAAMAGVMSVMRWRLVGEASALWIGVALVLYGAVTMLFPDLVREPGDEIGDSVLEFVRPAGVVVVMLLLALGLRAAPVDARLRPGRIVLGTIAAVAIVAAALQILPTAADVLSPPRNVAPEDRREAVTQSTMALVWLLLAATYVGRGLRAERMVYTWFGLMLFGLAESRFALALANPAEETWLTASQVIRGLGMAFGVFGAARGLQHAFVEQRAQLWDSLVQLRTEEARRRAAEAAEEERAHDVRSALFAIDGAARTLELHHDRLDEQTRGTLARGVSAEIARLQNLLAQVRNDPQPFGVDELLKPLVAMGRSTGLDISVDVPGDLTAVGRPEQTAEVIQNLLDNARRYAPGSPVVLRARQEAEWVVLRVQDRGPGIPENERDAIFERGRRGAVSLGTTGSGLGLFVATRLMTEQGGELWVEDVPGGGASFALCLRTPEERLTPADLHAVFRER